MAGVAAAKTLRPCRLVLTRQGNNLLEMLEEWSVVQKIAYFFLLF